MRRKPSWKKSDPPGIHATKVTFIGLKGRNNLHTTNTIYTSIIFIPTLIFGAIHSIKGSKNTKLSCVSITGQMETTMTSVFFNYSCVGTRGVCTGQFEHRSELLSAFICDH